MGSEKDWVKDMMMFGSESEKNKQDIINAACFVIAKLNARASGKKLSSEELDQLSGGGFISSVAASQVDAHAIH